LSVQIGIHVQTGLQFRLGRLIERVILQGLPLHGIEFACAYTAGKTYCQG
jgi:hypothetical protein